MVFRNMIDLLVGLVPQLPCPMILSWDCPGLKDIFQKVTKNLEILCLWKDKGKGMVGQSDSDNKEPDELDMLRDQTGRGRSLLKCL